MAPPLVSAVTIVRNGERFLEDAIESVLGQTHDNLELVVVDDGSTDRSAEIAERFVCQEPDRIRLAPHAGGGSRGMSAARVRGVETSRGGLIGFLDADDVWLPDKIAEQVEILEAHPDAGMVYGRTQMWYSWDPNPGRADFFYGLGVEPDRLYPALALLPQLLENRFQSPTTCNALIRRDAYEQAGGFEGAFRALYEDQVFFAKLYRRSPTYVSSRFWARYRRHEANEPPRRFSYARYYGERRAFLEWLAQYLADIHLETELADVLTAELERARHPYRAALEARLRTAAPAVARMRRSMEATVSAAMGTRQAPQWDWGDFRRLRPISDEFGYDRGLPIDRYYIERFLEGNHADVAGRTLEVGDDEYTRRYGGDRTTRRDVLHVHGDNSEATIVADLADAPQIADDTFDCVILTQTLHLIYDVGAAIATVHRILRPGGTVLATFPGISQVSGDEWSTTWSWALGSRLARELFASRFGERNVTVEAHGNSLAAAAFLQGVATHELTHTQLDADEPGCELLVAVRAVK